MSKLLPISLTCVALLISGCARSPIAVQEEASKVFESGDTQQAIEVLEGERDDDEYVTGNLLAFLYMREQFYEKEPDGYAKAIRVLQSINAHEPTFPVINVYLDVLEFDALSHAGNGRAADQVMQEYCPDAMEASERRMCIRTKIARVLLHLLKEPGPDTRFYKEFLVMTRAACIKTYGWDALMSRDEVAKEESEGSPFRRRSQ